MTTKKRTKSRKIKDKTRMTKNTTDTLANNIIEDLDLMNKENTYTEDKQPILRIPRPLGLTITNLTQKPKNTINHLLQHYINNNFTINSKYYTINDLSTVYQIPLPDIYDYIGNHNNNVGQLLNNKEAITNQMRALTQSCINGALEDRGLITEQLHKMLGAQGVGYKAFISGEVNKTLKLLLDSGKNMRETVALLTQGGPTATTNIFMGNEANTTEDQGQAFYPEDAINLLNDRNLNNTRSDEAAQAQLFEKHNINDTPEVCAKLMKDTENSVPTLGIEAIEDVDFTTLPKGLGADDEVPNSGPNKEPITHGNRREEEHEIDTTLDQI